MEYYIKERSWKQILEFIKSVKGMHSKDEKRLNRGVWYMVRIVETFTKTMVIIS
ncbi:MAG: hypothetical protein ACR5KV_05645 [Wolbachia sp.]